jgi:programmed cell death 6-interacting protein
MPTAQNIMLAVHGKRTDQLEIKSPILTYIRATYGDGDADDAIDDLAAIQGLRNEIVTAQGGTQGVSKETLVKWVPLGAQRVGGSSAEMG